MTVRAIVFMCVVYAGVTALVIFCYYKVLTKKKRK